MKRCIQFALKRISSFRRDERGYAVMATLAIFLFLFVLCAAVYAVGETIHERIKIQNACDAAAYSAAVVQADGLSRMACVNRAMSWTYVQMSNRQMDYITYRWLKLTCKRFGEDKKNADEYATQLVLSIDPNLGWWGLLTAAVSAAADIVFDMDCASGGHESKSNGLATWTGLSYKDQEVKLNYPKIHGIPIPWHLTESQVENILSYLTIFDGTGNGSSDEARKWGALLGTLIDYDKINIYQMNKSLARINYEMTRSMRETAENVLKAALTDNRYASQKSLSDYYVSINIPYARDPYSVRKGEMQEASSRAYFSPLRNTEVDERMFLQFQSKKLANKPLAAHFPKLLIGNTSTAFGLDQWFVRGKGEYINEDSVIDDSEGMMSRYDDEVDLWMKSPATNTVQRGRSSWLKPDSDALLAVGPRITNARLTGTVRSEGSLGIQRVYKDANLNETDAGFWRIPVDRGNHFFDLTEIGNWAVDSLSSAFKTFFGGESKETSGDDSDDDDSVEDAEKAKSDAQEELAKLKAEKERLENEIAAEKNKDPVDADHIAELEDKLEDVEESIAEIEDDLADAKDAEDADDDEDTGSSATGGKDIGGSASGSKGNGDAAGQLISKIFTAIFEYVGDEVVDISPSCENKQKRGFRTFRRKDKAQTLISVPMCARVAETTALFSEYRWASCKYYCLTRVKTWALSVLFGFRTKKCSGCKEGCGPYTGNKSKHKRIYCNLNRKHTFAKFFRKKIRGKGRGHYGFPKWFCGTEPKYMGAEYMRSNIGKVVSKLLKYFPPLDKEDIVGDVHGYMSDTWDLGGNGFLKPVRPLWDSNHRKISRDEYESCACFPDGTFIFAKGSDSHAGIVRGHARIYGDDKEIFDNRYVGAKCMPWILNEKFFNGEGTIIIGAAKKFYNPFSQLIGLLGNEKAIADYDKSVLSAFKIPKNNYMWTMSAARAGVRRHRRNGKFDQARMYQITYDSTPDAATLHYNSNDPVLYDHENGIWNSANCDSKKEADVNKNPNTPLVWDGCVCRTENEGRFRVIWNLCESDWDATLLPLRYSWVGASLYLPTASGRDRRAFMKETIRDRRNMVDEAYQNNIDGIGAGTNWVWTATSDILDPQSCEKNPFTDSWWKRATDDYFDVLNLGTHSLQFLPEANTFRDKDGNLTDNQYWSMFQLNRIL